MHGQEDEFEALEARLAAESPSMAPEAERELIEAAQGGDRAAFSALVEAYRERALAGAISLVQNAEDARDLTQDAFLRAFTHLKRFQLGRPFYPWYYRILRNLCLSHLERHGPKRKVSLDQMIEDDHRQFEQPGEDVREKIQRDEMAVHLRAAIGELKPEFREIIMMQHFEEMSYEEMAKALRIPKGTVMSRLFHARKALAELVKQRMR